MIKPLINSQSKVENLSIYNHKNITLENNDDYVLDFDIKPGSKFSLKGSCLYENNHTNEVDNHKAALVIVQFLDIDSKIIAQKYNSLTFSDFLQNYFHYIKASSNEEKASFDIKLLSPKNAVKLRLGLKKWNSQENIIFPEVVLEENNEKDVFCNLCNSYNFVDYQGRKNARCSICGSLERIRIFHLAYNKFIKPYYSFSDKDILVCGTSKAKLDYILHENKSLVSFDVNPAGLFDMQMDITNMEQINDGSFDTFIAIGVLQQIEDDLKAMEEIYRVLRKQGRVFIQTNVKCSALYSEEINFRNGRTYGLVDIIKLMNNYFIVHTYYGYDPVAGNISPIICGIKE